MIVAISTGPSTHLDHFAPLCYALKIPLIITSEEHLSLGKKFYPMIDWQFIPLEDLTLEFIAKNFDAILTSGKFWAMELKEPLKLFFNKDIRFIFTPHGHSDKEDFLDPVSQDTQLSYKKMGNIRHLFYKEFQTHFDSLAAGFFKSEKKTALYAPTWETKATSSSFFEKTSEIVEALSGKYNLLIKLHPLLEENDPVAFHRILGKHDTQAQFILDFPPIYPLLEKTDIYLGDFSSIGYDFLRYDRPMFFLNSKGNLTKCGEPFNGDLSGKQENLSEVRKKTYEDVFGKLEIKTLREQGLREYVESYSSS